MWYIGQKVVCVVNGFWSIQTSKDPKIPKEGDIFTINYINDDFLGFKEACQEHEYEAKFFRPLLTDSIRFAEETLHKISTHIEMEIEQFILN